MKKAHIHGAAVEHTEVAAIGIRQHRFWPKLGADLFQPGGDFVECLVPRDAPEGGLAARALGRNPPHGMENAIGRIHTVKILRDFSAEKSLGYGMRRIALDARCAAVLDGNKRSASVGTIMWACGMDDSFHG